MHPNQFLLDILIILVAAKLGAEASERLKQPAVIGELLAGVLVGGGLLGPLSHHFRFLSLFVISGKQPMLDMIGQLGVVLLLFETGLESNLTDLKKLGGQALWVAFFGVGLTILFGWIAGLALGLAGMPAIFVGAALAATSVGITARTFSDLRRQHTIEAKAVLGAAVADDVIGLVVLAVVTGVVSSRSISFVAILRTSAIAILFLCGSLFIGVRLAPHILRFASRMKTRAALSSAALIFCLVLSTAAGMMAGLSPIIGAFAAGLVLSQTEQKLHIEQRIKPVADVFIPVFFVLMGASMPILALNPATAAGRTSLLLAGILLVAAAASKMAASLSFPFTRLNNRLVVGLGMIPRGEVTLIFAAYGLKSGVIGDGLYSSLLLVVMLTTFITPFLLKLAIGESQRAGVEAGPAPMPPAPEQREGRAPSSRSFASDRMVSAGVLPPEMVASAANPASPP